MTEDEIVVGVGADEDALVLTAGALSFQMCDDAPRRGVETVAEPPLEEGGVVAWALGMVMAPGDMWGDGGHGCKDKVRRGRMCAKTKKWRMKERGIRKEEDGTRTPFGACRDGGKGPGPR